MKFYCCHVFVGCMLYAVGIPGVAGIGVTGGGGPSRKERENNGLDVAIILDPHRLNCPNHEKDMCAQNSWTVILTRMDIANCELNEIFSEKFTFRHVHLEIPKIGWGMHLYISCDWKDGPLRGWAYICCIYLFW